MRMNRGNHIEELNARLNRPRACDGQRNSKAESGRVVHTIFASNESMMTSRGSFRNAFNAHCSTCLGIRIRHSARFRVSSVSLGTCGNPL